MWPACPPEQMEDNRMENGKQTEIVTERSTETEGTNPSGMTVKSLLYRMDAIRHPFLLFAYKTRVFLAHVKKKLYLCAEFINN